MAMSDAQIVTILDRTAAVADPILDILANSDPFDLKPRTHARAWDRIPTSVADAAATALQVSDWPGTAGWEALSRNERADWWVGRIGAVNTVAVAFPSMFGAWTKKVPIGAFLGAASQALMVLAVGREYGVVDRSDQIAMLGSVLFGRELAASDSTPVARQEFPQSGPALAKAVLKGMWDIATGLRSLTKALGARPQAPRVFGYLMWLPLIGGPAAYLGERVALCRAVAASKQWIVDHREAIDV
ncbi:hypothetical protein ACFQNE_15420 [Gordonia phosphorivorans]|uniref:EcsC family protein n=1 Tax=Gordonia phosphorivorans TaxID=1056982 RepID=A0ABV6HB68_9ACTN